MTDDFDPADPRPAGAGNVLHEYQQAPQGLTAVTVIQALLAVLLGVYGLPYLLAGTASAMDRLLALLPAFLFAASAAGLLRRRGWGWWLTIAIYSFMFFTVPVSVVLWTFGRMEFSVTVQLGLLVGSMLMVAYLSRVEVLRFIRFGTQDGRPSARARWTPTAAGLIGALIGFILQWRGA